MDFESLSLDSLTDVLLSTPIPDLTSCCKTSKRIEQICASDSFWPKRITQDFPTSVANKPVDLSWKDWYIQMSEFQIDLIQLDSNDREAYITEEILPEVLKQLKILEQRSTELAKIYFSGEWDSNQTDFEEQSNRLEVGVISPSKFVALILFRFVRIMVDDRQDLLDNDLFDYYYDLNEEERKITFEEYKKIPIPLSKFLNMLSENEQQYMNCFNLSDEFKCKLGYGERKEVIKKRIHEVNIWTLPRLEKAMQDDINWR